MPQKAWAIGEEVLAADFNTYLQNQCVPAFTNVAQRDAQWAAPPNGGLCVTVDTNTLWQRIGGVWQTLHPTTAKARVFRTAAWTLNLSGAPPIPFDTVSYGTGFAAGVYTCPVAGDYLVVSAVGMTAPAAASQGNLLILRNGAIVANGQSSYQPNNGWGMSFSGSEIVACAAANTLSVSVTGLAAGTTTGQNGSNVTFMSVRLLL